MKFITTSISKDVWLSEQLQRDVYKAIVREADSTGNENIQQKLDLYLNKDNVFIYSKVPTINLRDATFLEKKGFHLVDTNITLEKEISNSSGSFDKNELRFATPEDKENVTEIARNAFTHSRFHLDPTILDDKADEIKAMWACNYFLGRRGNSMVVATVDGKAIGFLLLLFDRKTLVIDLIAMDKKHRKKGLAEKMVSFAEKELSGFKHFRVGTQVANLPSINFYEKLDFRICDTSYIFHFHGVNKQ